MIVTSVTGVAVSFRTVTLAAPHANVQAANRPITSASDSVELSQQAAAEARTTDPTTARDETQLKLLDTDRDGVVSRTEFTAGASVAIRRYTNLPQV